MKKRDILELNETFRQLKDFGNTKFKYAILKNIDNLKSHLVGFDQLETESKEVIKDFESDRNELIVELGVAGESGNYTIDQKDEDTMNIFKNRLEELIKKHKDSLDNYNVKVAEFEELLNEDIDDELNFRQINVDSLPDNGVTAEQLIKLIEAGIVE